VTAVNILVFAGILIVLVLLHEAGHLIVAKWCGMRVERFSVFFGKPIWSFRRGETEYGFGWLPLGGYVKITGMTRDELVHRVYDPETGALVAEIPEPPEVQARAYCNASTSRKIATIFAGPAANVIVAVIAFAISFWIGIPQYGNNDVVRLVTAGSPAQTADLRAGDRVVSINGVRSQNGDPTPLRDVLQSNPGKSVTLVVERGGRTVTIVTPKLVTDPNNPKIGRLGFQFGERKVGQLQFGPGAGLREAVQYTGFLTKEQVKALGRLFVDQKTRSEVSSVVGIGATYNDIAGTGTGTVFRFIGILSLILAIMNLLPLLPLDGGHIVFALAEKIRGRPLPIAAFQRASTVGIVIVAFFFLYALNNDIARFTGQGFKP
jgi:regulator of sigma E protease